MFDATAHIVDAIARLPPCSPLLDVFYTFHRCFFHELKKTNEDTLVAIIEKLSPSRKRSANEKDELFDATAHIVDAIARLQPCSPLLDVFYPFHSCFFHELKKTNEDTLVAIMQSVQFEVGPLLWFSPSCPCRAGSLGLHAPLFYACFYRGPSGRPRARMGRPLLARPCQATKVLPVLRRRWPDCQWLLCWPSTRFRLDSTPLQGLCKVGIIIAYMYTVHAYLLHCTA